MYNCRHTGAPTKEFGAVYFLAHRGIIGYMKQSRLASAVRRGRWQDEFNQVIDVPVMTWKLKRTWARWYIDAGAGNSDISRGIYGSVSPIQGIRLEVYRSTRDFWGGPATFGGIPAKFIRTDRQRKADNTKRRAARYNTHA